MYGAQYCPRRVTLSYRGSLGQDLRRSQTGFPPGFQESSEDLSSVDNHCLSELYERNLRYTIVIHGIDKRRQSAQWKELRISQALLWHDIGNLTNDDFVLTHAKEMLLHLNEKPSFYRIFRGWLRARTR
jgi:hypothetical protein